MKYVSKNKFWFLVLMLFLGMNKVFAIEVIDYSLSGYTGGGGSGNKCGSTVACFRKQTRKPIDIAYRFTLVDKMGNKVEDTTSVDFTGSSQIYNYLSKKEFSLLPVKYSDGKTYYANYKYGKNKDNKFLWVNATDSKNLKGAKGPTFDNINDIRKQIVDYEAYPYYDYNGMKMSFLELFLNLSGFLDEQFLYENDLKLNEIANNGYYIIYEPTLFMYTTGHYYYGTVTEFADYMFGRSSSDPFARDAGRLRQYSACHIYTDANSNFGVVKDAAGNVIENRLSKNLFKNYCNFDQASLPNNQRGGKKWPQSDIALIVDRSYGYGMGLISLKDIVIPRPVDNVFDLKLCESSEGYITFDTEDWGTLGAESLKKDIFKVSGEDESDATYCYDTVLYDFASTLFGLQGKKQLFTNVDVIPANAYITRTCYIPNASSYNIELETNRDYSSEKNKIVLNIYDKDYEFKSDISYSTLESDNNIYTYTVNITYTIPDMVRTSANSTSSVGKIIFKSNEKNVNAFGASNGLINYNMSIPENLVADTEYVYSNKDDTSSKIIYSDGIFADGEFSCKFNYDVEGSSQLVYRTISLNNPFPARDGSSRLPGMNWLSGENYVYDYILNNRGIMKVTDNSAVSPEEMYKNDKIKPMYTFVLDPSTMASIRQYNKTHSYTDQSSLHCSDDGRECYSDFIRKYLSKTHVDGSDTCFLTSSTNDTEIRNSFNTKIDITDKDYDFDGKVGDYDDKIVETYKDKNVQFYTCANKTFLSGGPLNMEVD